MDSAGSWSPALDAAIQVPPIGTGSWSTYPASVDGERSAAAFEDRLQQGAGRHAVAGAHGGVGAGVVGTLVAAVDDGDGGDHAAGTGEAVLQLHLAGARGAEQRAPLDAHPTLLEADVGRREVTGAGELVAGDLV